MPFSKALAVVALIAASGCARPPHPFQDPPLPPESIGDLTKPVATMTAHELWVEGKKLQWLHGKQQRRQCEDGNCNGRIDVVANQQPPGPNRLGTYGTIVGRFANLGIWGGTNDEGPETRYGTKKGDGADYYLIALPVSGGGWSWTVREAIHNGGGIAEEKSFGLWEDCTADSHNPNHPPAGVKSEFYKCVKPPVTMSTFPMARPYLISDPGWMICEMGCCTAGY